MQQKQRSFLLLTLALSCPAIITGSTKQKKLTATATSAGGNTFSATVDPTSNKIQTTSERHTRAVRRFSGALAATTLALPLLAGTIAYCTKSKRRPYLIITCVLLAACIDYSFIIKPTLKQYRAFHLEDVKILEEKIRKKLNENSESIVNLNEATLQMALQDIINTNELDEPLRNHTLREIIVENEFYIPAKTHETTIKHFDNIRVTVDLNAHKITLAQKLPPPARIKNITRIEKEFSKKFRLHNDRTLNEIKRALRTTILKEKHAQLLFEKNLDEPVSNDKYPVFYSNYRHAPTHNDELVLMVKIIRHQIGMKFVKTDTCAITVSRIDPTKELPFSLADLEKELNTPFIIKESHSIRYIDTKIIEIATRLASQSTNKN